MASDCWTQFLIFGALLFVAAAQPVAAQTKPLIYMNPRDDRTKSPSIAVPVTQTGSVDYLELFTPQAPWTNVAAQVDVFAIHDALIPYYSDSQWSTIIADLKQRGIPLGVEGGVLTPGPDGCGTGIEGFGTPGALAADFQRMKSLGADIRYLAIDGAWYYGHFYDGPPTPCNWSATEIAQNAAVQIAQVRAVFPGIQVGSIDQVPTPVNPVPPDWLAQMTGWWNALKTATGQWPAFVFADINWLYPDIVGVLDTMRQQVKSMGIPWGPIYNGLPTDQTDAQWTSNATQRYHTYELQSQFGPPDFAVFESWDAYPQHNLPETDPTTFTGYMNVYLQPRTTISLTPTATAVKGTLTSDGGQPVAGAPVSATMSGLSGNGVPTTYTVTGTIPTGTQSIALGFRVNTACSNCSGPAEFWLTSLELDPDSGPPIVGNFLNQLQGWGLSADPGTTAQLDGTTLHVSAQEGQVVTLNSPPIPLTTGSTYQFKVNAQVSPISGGSGYLSTVPGVVDNPPTNYSIGSGYFSVFFLGATSEIARTEIFFQPAQFPLTAQTGADGSFSFPVPAGLQSPGENQIQASYAGSASLWPALTTTNYSQPSVLPDLTVTKTHNGNFLQGQSGATYTITVGNGGSGPTSGTVTMTDTVPSGLTATGLSGTGWSCTVSTATCTRSDTLGAGGSYQSITLTVNVAGNAPASVANTATVSGGGETNTGNDTANDLTTITVSSTTYTISGQVTVSGSGLGGVTVMLGGSQSSSTTTDFSGNYAFNGVAGNGSYTVTPARSGYAFNPVSFTFSNLSGNQVANFSGAVVAGLEFYPVTPCRVADTRSGAGFSGAFGPPSMTAGAVRSFPIPFSNCGIPATAAAYSFNFTVVPPGPVGVLITWPTGQSMPNASTLNDPTGTVVANAAIVPAGTNGGINVYVNNSTDLLFDINGYFAPPAAGGLQFYPVTPCRIADTRTGAGFSGAFGPPTMAAGSQRSFPIPTGSCGIPATAAAYSLNFTVVPPGPLGFLTTWPTGQPMPNASTLNSYTGTVVANAAIVPAGSSGAISVYVNSTTDVLFDINGYFAPPAVGGLQFYPVTPCRIADTRTGAGFSGAFGPPTMATGAQRSFPIPSSTCGIPATAAAYSFNFTVVPAGPLGVLTTWPTGQSMPNASTLNSYNGTVVANAAIVPAGTAGAVSVYVNSTTDVLFDINGYFAQ